MATPLREMSPPPERPETELLTDSACGRDLTAWSSTFCCPVDSAPRAAKYELFCPDSDGVDVRDVGPLKE